MAMAWARPVGSSHAGASSTPPLAAPVTREGCRTGQHSPTQEELLSLSVPTTEGRQKPGVDTSSVLASRWARAESHLRNAAREVCSELL